MVSHIALLEVVDISLRRMTADTRDWGRIGSLANWLGSVVFLLLFPQICGVLEASATALQITNISTTNLDQTNGTVDIEFDIAWNDSWRLSSGPINWDAAWVFVKFKKNGGDWKRATLLDSGHTAPSGSEVVRGLVDEQSAFNISTNPAVGAFIYRSAVGQGTFSKQNVRLRWKYSQDGVSVGDSLSFRVFGVEMVYISQGEFYAGDSEINYYALTQGSTDYDPWYISGEGAITTTNTAGTSGGTNSERTETKYYYRGPILQDGEIFTLPAAFPKGFNATYMMKYEITQEQWTQFFNTLPSGTPQDNHDVTGAKGSSGLIHHNNVSWSGSGDASLPDQGSGATYCSVAMNYLSWPDLAAYLDWSGLRPFTELEFEKACRGPSDYV